MTFRCWSRFADSPWHRWSLRVWCCWPKCRVHCCSRSSGRPWAPVPEPPPSAPSPHWSEASPPGSGHGAGWGPGKPLPCLWWVLTVCHILQRRKITYNVIPHKVPQAKVRTWGNIQVHVSKIIRFSISSQNNHNCIIAALSACMQCMQTIWCLNDNSKQLPALVNILIQIL